MQALNSPATLHTLMNGVIDDCMDKLFMVYNDDLPIFSRDKEGSCNYLEIVIEWLQGNQLYEYIVKCEFFKEEINFSGIFFDKYRSKIDLKKLGAFQSWPRAKFVKNFRSFIRLLQFSQFSTSNFAKIETRSTNLTEKVWELIIGCKM